MTHDVKEQRMISNFQYFEYSTFHREYFVKIFQ